MDPRFLKEQGTSIFTGNELIVKGALENGVGEITGYHGSPLAELFDTLENIRDLHGVLLVFGSHSISRDSPGIDTFAVLFRKCQGSPELLWILISDVTES